MSENRNAPSHADALRPRACERAEELVTYLYGESTTEEARLFRRHLETCEACREELAAFGDVRAGVGHWRTEGLGVMPPLDIEGALAPLMRSGRTDARRRSSAAVRERSAAAALREFFALSPLWLRAGALAATLAVCALAALVLARTEVRWDSNGLALRAGVGERVVKEQEQVPLQVGYTEEQVNAIVARKVAETQARLEERQTETAANSSTDDTRNAFKPSDARARTWPASAATNAQRRRRTTRQGTRRDEPLLAEDNLPRLSDLLGGSY